MTSPRSEWSATRPLFWGFLTVGIMVGGLGAWSVLTTLSGAIIAPGQIEVSQSRQIVQHPDGGVVTEILVTEGAKVAVGDVVLRLDGAEVRSQLAIDENQIYELEARRARLEALRDGARDIRFPADLLAAAAVRADVAEMVAGQKGLLENQATALEQATGQRRTRILQIEDQVKGIAAQQEAIAAQIALLEEDLETQRDLLSRGLTQSARVLSVERDLAQLRGRAGELLSARSEAAGRITETEIEITALVTDHREKAETELRDVVARLLELQERQAALAERVSRLDVRAPAAGLVLGLQVTTPQSVIRPADPLMYIVPQDRPLLVAARVPAMHVDEVRPGQEVRLVFSSLSSRTTPEVTGQITLVSADALVAEGSNQAYFRTEISLDAGTLAALGGVRIVPGMPVEAFIRTADRTPLSYLLKPFTDYFRNAFRES